MFLSLSLSPFLFHYLSTFFLLTYHVSNMPKYDNPIFCYNNKKKVKSRMYPYSINGVAFTRFLIICSNLLLQIITCYDVLKLQCGGSRVTRYRKT